MTKNELIQIQNYMRKTFGSDQIRLMARANKDDSAEVMIGDEFIGVIFRDDEDEDTSYDFHMTILDVDLA